MITASSIALGLYCALSVIEFFQTEHSGRSRFVKTLLMPVLTAFYLLAARQFGRPVFPLAVLEIGRAHV